MASTARPQKLYEQFEPQERLVLMLEASARGDETEADRVRASCPRKTYSGPDTAFDDRRSMVLDIAMAVCGDMGALVRQLRLLKWVKEDVGRRLRLHEVIAALAFTEGVRCAQGLPPLQDDVEMPEGAEAEELPEEDDPPLPAGSEERLKGVHSRSELAAGLILESLDQAALALGRELGEIWTAFGQFCTSRVGLSPEKVLDGCGYPQRKQLSETLAKYGQATPAPPDAASIDRYRDMLCRVWDRWFEEE